MPTPHPDKPRYRHVAAELRRRIAAGAIPRGSLLPSEPTLMAEFGVARGTVRDAIRLLREEGLIVTEHGRGSIVRAEQPVRRISSERYRRQLDRLARGGDQSGRAGREPASREPAGEPTDVRLDRETREVPATPAVAELFKVPPGTMLLERRIVVRTHDVPQQMSVSYYPLDVVAATPVADPAREPSLGGNLAQLHSLGISVTGVRERVRARMPVPEEMETLRMPAGVPVLTITRQMYAGPRVVEAAVDIVIPADRVELDYWISLDQS